MVATLMGEFDGLVERTLPIDFASAMQCGRLVGNLLPLFDARFYRGPLFHLIYRPYHMHHAIDAVVRDGAGKGRGAFVLGRSARQPDFSAAEQDALRRLLPYLDHALNARDEGAMNDFTDHGDSGLVILDRAGKVAWASARARQLLYLASQPAGGGPVPLCDASEAGAAALQRVCNNLVRIFQDGDAAPPATELRTAWGRFIFRAHWLEPGGGSEAGALVGVVVQQQERAAVALMRNMRAAGLSQRQRDVTLLLAQNQSFDAIASRLHISHATAKDYAQRIYRKLNVHTREELLQRLR